MVDEVKAKQGREGKTALGILEISLGLVVLCFAALLLIAIGATPPADLPERERAQDRATQEQQERRAPDSDPGTLRP